MHLGTRKGMVRSNVVMCLFRTCISSQIEDSFFPGYFQKQFYYFLSGRAILNSVS